MADRLNPAERTAAESDYQKKFNRTAKQDSATETDDIKRQESSGDAEWKTVTKAPEKKEADKKGRFRFSGRKGGKIRQGSALFFIIVLVLGGVWYTSVFAPNILLVNIKEMYTNDLADATTALEIYTQIMYFNKIGPGAGQGCEDTKSVKCRLTTMSRYQKEAFERQGFTVLGTKVQEDNRDDGDAKNDQPESRYKVTAIIPPNYKQTIDAITATGLSSFSDIIRGNGDASSGVTKAINQLMNPLKDASQSPQSLLNGILAQAPIASGPQLWLYSQLSTTTKAQVYSVFNPRSSFFTDKRFKERIKTRYNMTKAVTVSGNTEQKVNRSFDSAVQSADGGIDTLTGQPNPTDGVSLASLSGPLNLNQLQSMASGLTGTINQGSLNNMLGQLPMAADLQGSANLLATNTYSYTDLMCSWYTVGKATNNALIRAKASTAARYALQYLKAADAIKAGTAEEVPTNVLASKLAANATGNYGGGSATDSMIYKSITYGDTLPGSLSEFGSMLSDPGKLVNMASDAAAIVAYNLSAYENIGTLAASWLQIIPNAAALGSVVGASGSLMAPPLNTGGTDKQYCLSGETLDNKTETKGQTTNDTRCLEAVTSMSPIGMQAATASAAELGRKTCPPVNAADDNLVQALLGNWRGPVSNTMLPSQKATQATVTPYIASIFGVNGMIAATGTQQLYTSQIKGIPANYALFSGMGELLGDMAMSRGLMPSNVADMTTYLALGEVVGVQKNMDDVARYNAKQNPFDPYNKFSFLGSIVRTLPQPTTTNAPVLASLGNSLSVVNSAVKQIGQSSTANAFYHLQPQLLSGENGAERIAGYLLRLSAAYCPLDLEYLAIGIMPDIMCNIRYSMPLDDIATAINLTGVLDYMTGTNHSSVYDSKVQELEERVGRADYEGNKEYLSGELAQVNGVRNQAFIDKTTGKPVKGSEYEKYLQYCVNRLDPWGRSAIYMRYDGLSDQEKAERIAKETPNGTPLGTDYKGSPNQKTAGGIPTMAVNAAQSDQDWYTGKKCTRMTDQPEMLRYFRAYTTLCSVDGSMSNIIDCTEPDHESGYADPFYLNNDILYTSWY